MIRSYREMIKSRENNTLLRKVRFRFIYYEMIPEPAELSGRLVTRTCTLARGKDLRLGPGTTG